MPTSIDLSVHGEPIDVDTFGGNPGSRSALSSGPMSPTRFGSLVAPTAGSRAMFCVRPAVVSRTGLGEPIDSEPAASVLPGPDIAGRGVRVAARGSAGLRTLTAKLHHDVQYPSVLGSRVAGGGGPLRPRWGVSPALAVRVGALSVAVEEHDHFGGAVDCGERVGGHRVELGSLAGLDGDAPPTEQKEHPPFEHEEPVVADVHPLRGLDGGGIEPHLDRRGGRRRAAEHPRGAFRRPGGHWPDDYVAVVGARQQRIEVDLQGAGEGQQYIEAKGAPPRLHPADGRGAEVGACSQLVERQAEGRPQAAQALADQPVHLVGRGLRQGLLANSARYHA